MNIYCVFVFHCSSRTTGEDNNIRQQSKTEQFNCSLCTSSFFKRDNLRKHVLTKHGKLKAFTKRETDASFIYIICGGKFSREDN